MSETVTPHIHHEAPQVSTSFAAEKNIPAPSHENTPPTETLPAIPTNPATTVSHLLSPTLPVANETPPPVYSSVFTTDIAESLQRSGIQVNWVNPSSIAEGANHKVYEYNPPDQPKQVVKIAKELSTTTLTHGGAKGEEEAVETAYKAFGKYIAQTQIKQDPQIAEKYYVVQDAIKGKAISNMRHKEGAHMRKQLADIVRLNNVLYADKKMCLDFVGMAGFTGWLKKQFKKLLLRKSEFEVSNIIEDEHGDLKIIDFEYFDLGTKNIRKKVTNFIGMTVNRLLMKHYFGLDIKRAS